MWIQFSCPKCLETHSAEIALPETGDAASSGSASLTCPNCRWERRISPEGTRSGCVVCGCEDLWRQKDFPPRLGVAIVGLEVILTTIAWAYYMPLVAYGELMVFFLIDSLLFLCLPDALVCYRCHARYHRAADRDTRGAFDLEVHERYRQEGIRLAQREAAQAAAQSAAATEKHSSGG